MRTCLYEKDPKRMLVGLFNNDLFADWKGEVKVRRGTVAAAHELWHDVKLESGERGIPLTVSAGDVAMIEVRLR